MCRRGGIGVRAIGVLGRARGDLSHASREPRNNTLLRESLCGLQRNPAGRLWAWLRGHCPSNCNCHGRGNPFKGGDRAGNQLIAELLCSICRPA